MTSNHHPIPDTLAVDLVQCPHVLGPGGRGQGNLAGVQVRAGQLLGPEGPSLSPGPVRL